MMLQYNKLIRLPLVGLALLCVLVVVSLAVRRRKRAEKAGSKPRIIKHSVETPSEEVLKHWTADKMRDAKATNMPTSNDLKQVKQHSQGSTD
ncbi:MAG TPA: hypothetical protein VFB12_30310 [Ktedonobacteraceae bacterium]|nr:hypothetical protein [Ktedonobacteraceae bacterium]